MPEQDAVIAITSGVRVMPSVLNLVWDKLHPSMKPAPLATTPQCVAAAVKGALDPATLRAKTSGVVWVPAPLVGLATAIKFVPRPIWRKLEK